MIQLLIKVIVFVNTVVVTYVTWRQYRLLGCPQPKASRDILSAEDYGKATAYNKSKCAFSMVVGVYELVKELWLIGNLHLIYASLVKGLPQTECMMIVVYNLVNSLCEIPPSLYFDFVLEQKYGFNKKTLGTFFKDLLMGMCLGSVLAFVVAFISVAFLNSKLTHFYVYWWLCLCAVQLGILILYPNYISPLYNTFTPLPEGPLRTSVEELAKRVSFTADQILVMDGSRRSGHGNAYFIGFGKAKKIVFYDTILKQLSEDETLGVLCHELGHWSHCHSWVLLAVSFSVTFALISAFSYVVKSLAGYPVSLKIIYFLYLSNAIMVPLNLLQNLIVRATERQADRFAVRMGHSKGIRSGLIKLGVENKAAPVSDPLFSAFNYSHPPISERLELIDSETRKMA